MNTVEAADPKQQGNKTESRDQLEAGSGSHELSARPLGSQVGPYEEWRLVTKRSKRPRAPSAKQQSNPSTEGELTSTSNVGGLPCLNEQQLAATLKDHASNVPGGAQGLGTDTKRRDHTKG